jgi:hypothetical protein
MLMKLVIVSLLVCDLRWRRLWLRAPTAALLFWLALSSTAVAPAMRRALEHQQRIPWPGSPSSGLTSEYASGVLRMRQEAERDLDRVVFPIYALAWLSISHLLADSLMVVIHRRARTTAPSNP